MRSLGRAALLQLGDLARKRLSPIVAAGGRAHGFGAETAVLDQGLAVPAQGPAVASDQLIGGATAAGGPIANLEALRGKLGHRRGGVPPGGGVENTYHRLEFERRQDPASHASPEIGPSQSRLDSLGFYRLTPADQNPAPSVRRPGFVNPLGSKREFR